jgi:glycosyltransferase involved in cell wall biosynthesis
VLSEIYQYLRRKNFRYEILVIVNGSPNNTGEVAKNYVNRIKNLLVIDDDINRGKGYAVRQGLLQAKGAYRLFTDADGSTSMEHADEFLQEYQKGFDVVIASRDIEGSVIEIHQPRYRELMGEWAICLSGQHWVFGVTRIPNAALKCSLRILCGKFSLEWR